jgi:hypothetical protein
LSASRPERIKLLANALDRASTACFTVGIATPLAGYIYNIAGFRDGFDGDAGLDRLFVAGLGGWLAVALMLHLLARYVLRGLDQ